MLLSAARHGRVKLTAALLLGLFFTSGFVGAQESVTTAVSVERAKAIAVLAADATREEKVNACRRLAAVGGPESVAALAALLVDKDLSHAARMGLEAIPDPAAGEALRAALPNLTGGPLIGVINSLAARGESRAVPDLGGLLGNADPSVAAAACAALGTIASPDALQLLENAPAQLPPEARAEWGLACLRGVVALHRQGLDEQAAHLCQLLRAAQLPPHIHSAATRQAILIRPADAGTLLPELLTAADDVSFATALTVSRNLDASGVTETLIAHLAGLPTPRRTQLIRVLGDRGDPLARDALVQAAGSSDVSMRAAALVALGQTGNASTFPLLLAAAADTEAEIVAAAQQAMVRLSGEDVDAAVLAALPHATGPLRRILIDVIGLRHIAAATAELVPLASDPDAPTRLAALRALGEVIDPTQLPVLTTQLVASAESEQRATVEQALRVACRRARDKDACVRHLQSVLTQVDQGTKPFVIELLGSAGGPAALNTLATLARDADESVQDAATRELGRFRTPDVAPTLIDLAHTAPQEKFRIRALRGYLRVIRQMDVADADKLAMFREAMAAATRNEERVLAVETLGRIPTPAALAESVQQLGPDELRSAACLAAVTIAEGLVGSHPAEVAEAMRRVLEAAKDPDIRRRAEAVLAQCDVAAPPANSAEPGAGG